MSVEKIHNSQIFNWKLCKNFKSKIKHQLQPKTKNSNFYKLIHKKKTTSATITNKHYHDINFVSKVLVSQSITTKK